MHLHRLPGVGMKISSPYQVVISTGEFHGRQYTEYRLTNTVDDHRCYIYKDSVDKDACNVLFDLARSMNHSTASIKELREAHMSKEGFYALELIVFLIALLGSLFLMAGCATPQYSDGTKAAMRVPADPPAPCGPDTCGKKAIWQ